MFKRILPALCLSVLAATFSLGLILAIHDYVAGISSTTLGASLFTADAQQLAFGGYTTPSPSPSPTHTTNNPSNDGV